MITIIHTMQPSCIYVCTSGIEKPGKRGLSESTLSLFLVFTKFHPMLKQQSVFSYALSPLNLALAEGAEPGKDCPPGPLRKQGLREIRRHVLPSLDLLTHHHAGHKLVLFLSEVSGVFKAN